MRIGNFLSILFLFIGGCASVHGQATSQIDETRLRTCGEIAHSDPERCSALILAIEFREAFVTGDRRVILDLIPEVLADSDLHQFIFGKKNVKAIDCSERIVAYFLFYCSQEDVLYYVERINAGAGESGHQFRLYFVPHTGEALESIPPIGNEFDKYISTVAVKKDNRWFLIDPFWFSKYREND